MKTNLLLLFGLLLIIFSSCSNRNDTVQIGENTFVYKNRVYRIIDNEVREIGNLKSDSIKLFQIIKPVKRNFGQDNLDYVKQGAYANLDALYRGSILYFNLHINGFNDLKEAYNPGSFIIHFEDEFGFIIHTTEISTVELTALVNQDKTIIEYSYNGKTEMSTDIYRAIRNYSISSTVKVKSSRFSYW
jgi:hypothetical protein